jgi:hypothetical protein
MYEINQTYLCFSEYLWRLHVNVRNYRKILNDFYVLNWILKKNIENFFIKLVKFKSMKIDVKLSLTDINQVLKDFNVK